MRGLASPAERTPLRAVRARLQVTKARRSNPLSILLVMLLAAAGWGVVGDRVVEGVTVQPGEDVPSVAFDPAPRPSVTLGAATTCANAGYLCAEIGTGGSYRVQRWRALGGPMIVFVPRPDFEDATSALALQRAAVAGIRAWNNQPFPILVDTRGTREAHITVRWRRSLPGTQIGLARTRWSVAGGMTAVTIELTTRNPYELSQIWDPRRVRLTAAHEMGHALGLPHSDSERDVMYETNTATSVSARDRRTMEVLYDVPDGAEIVR
jgi:hypothetical protein